MLSEYYANICVAVIIAVSIMVVVCIAVGFIAYIMGYKDAMNRASQTLDEAFDKKSSAKRK